MSNSNSLTVLTPMLNGIGERRLFEFLDFVDTTTAARFRVWLSTATDIEVRAAADVLNRSSHGREFAGWWQTRDRVPVTSTAQSDVRQFSSSPVAQPYRRASAQAPNRSIRNAGIPFIVMGYVLMVAGRLSASAGGAGAIFGVILGLVGLVLNIGGCMKYAEEKGHSRWVGLVGLLSCVGLLILLMLPDRYRRVR